MRRLNGILIVPTGLVLACAVLDSNPEPREELRAARREWTRHGMERYEYDFQRSACECLPEWTRPYVIGVDRDYIIYVRDFETGAAAPEAFQPYTISQLFDLIEDALDRRPHVLIVEYHPRFGYPSSISIDYDRQIADDEIMIRAQNVRPLLLPAVDLGSFTQHVY